MTNNLFLFWIGKEYKLIKILRNIIYLHSTNGIGYKVHLINHENIKNYLENIPECFYELCPAHQADYVRVHVILKYGGIWMDSDTLVLDSLDELFKLINDDNTSGFFVKNHNLKLSNGLFGSKANTELFLEWTKNINYILNTKKNINWTEMGTNVLEQLLNTTPELYDKYMIFIGSDNLYPVDWKICVSEYIKKPYDNYKKLLREFQPLIILVNSVYKELENKSEKEILEGNMPLNYFLNKSFENIKHIVN